MSMKLKISLFFVMGFVVLSACQKKNGKEGAEASDSLISSRCIQRVSLDRLDIAKEGGGFKGVRIGESPFIRVPINYVSQT